MRINQHVIELFHKYSWPGNVRELKNVLTSAICSLEENESELDISHLPVRIMENMSTVETAPKRNASKATLVEASNSAEREAILVALKRTGFNKSLTARELGISRTKLYKKMQQLGIS